MRVLLIENDQWLADSLQNSLPFEIKTAPDVEAALGLIDDWRPDVIVTDLILGAKNALALLMELQSYVDTRDIPIILLAIDGHRLELEDLRRFGVRRIIDKADLEPAELTEAIKNV
jgi:DNA-binding NarL/FixJ family response regulator